MDTKTKCECAAQSFKVYASGNRLFELLIIPKMECISPHLKSLDSQVKSPVIRKKGNITPVFRKGRKEYLGNYRLGEPPSVTGRMMEQILMEALLRDIQDRR